MNTTMGIELLESRVAPAVIVLNAHTASYLDADGDHVTIRVSSGDLHNAIFTTSPAGSLGGEQLELLNLVSGFDGANLTINVAKAKTGDGVANVGAILATGENLGKVAVAGDLGQIDAGANDPRKPAIKSLKVLSMGAFGLATQGGQGDLSSDINGTLGSLNVANDVNGATINVFGGANAKLGSASIGGSLIGGTGDGTSGALMSTGDMGPVRIGKDLAGGTGFNSGFIQSGGDLASVTIGGSMLGGSGFPFAGLSGAITSGGDMGLVKIGHDVTSGPRDQTALIASQGKLAGVRIGGSFTGGPLGENMGKISSALAMGSIEIGHDVLSGNIDSGSTILSIKIGGSFKGGGLIEAGRILSASDMGPVKIGGDLQGGGLGTGRIDSGGKLSSVTVGGSVLGGDGGSSGAIQAETIGTIKIGGDLQAGQGPNSGSIRAGEDIGSIVVGGSILGSSTLSGNSPVIISAVGQANPTATTDQAIGSIKVRGQVQDALILGGYNTGVFADNTQLSFANKNAQIGSVKVGGDWIASSLVAGAIDNNNDGFGNADDTAGGAGPVISKIASIIISGKVLGTAQSGDHFGFESSQIGSFRSQGFVAPLTAAPGEVFELSPDTGDVTIREVLPV